MNEFAKKLNENSIQYRSFYIPEIDLTQLFFKDPAGVTIELNFSQQKNHPKGNSPYCPGTEGGSPKRR